MSLTLTRLDADHSTPPSGRAWALLCGAAGVGGSAGAAALVALTNGNVWAAPALCAAVAVVCLLVWRLELGIYLLLAAVLLLEQYGGGRFDSAFERAGMLFYLNLNSSTGIGGLVLNPIEILLALVVAAWFLRAAVSRDWHLHPVPHPGIAALFLLMLAAFTAYGLAHGGDWKVAGWEIRPLFYLVLTNFLAVQVIRTPRQLRLCVWIIIGGLACRGLQGCWRFFVTLGGDLGNLRAILGHEDSLFFATGFFLLAGFFFLGYRGREFALLLVTAAPTFLAFVLNQRRVVYGVLGLCLGMLVALLPPPQRRRALRLVIPLALCCGLYTAVFWNSSGLKAMPAQKIKSVLVKQPGTEDESSNLWRESELLNLKETVRAFPLGIGFGQKFMVVVPYPDIGEFFPLWQYIPHCAIYWLWVKTGFVGFAIFWLFFGVALAQAVIDYRALHNPYYKAVALTVLLFIVGQLLVAYYDLQLTYYRNMIYLGIALALGTVARRLETAAPTAPSLSAVAPGGRDGW